MSDTSAPAKDDLSFSDCSTACSEPAEIVVGIWMFSKKEDSVCDRTYDGIISKYFLPSCSTEPQIVIEAWGILWLLPEENLPCGIESYSYPDAKSRVISESISLMSGSTTFGRLTTVLLIASSIFPSVD